MQVKSTFISMFAPDSNSQPYHSFCSPSLTLSLFSDTHPSNPQDYHSNHHDYPSSYLNYPSNNLATTLCRTLIHFFFYPSPTPLSHTPSFCFSQFSLLLSNFSVFTLSLLSLSIATLVHSSFLSSFISSFFLNLTLFLSVFSLFTLFLLSLSIATLVHTSFLSSSFLNF